MTIFTIGGTNHCWICGVKTPNSKHHGIPVFLKPKHNVIIPVCEECHTKMNQVDYGALSSYAYKILKTLGQQTRAINHVLKVTERSLDNKSKLKEENK